MTSVEELIAEIESHPAVVPLHFGRLSEKDRDEQLRLLDGAAKFLQDALKGRHRGCMREALHEHLQETLQPLSDEELEKYLKNVQSGESVIAFVIRTIQARI
jgi:hypothetical protein